MTENRVDSPSTSSPRSAMLRTFRLYRVNPPAEYRAGGYANAPDDPQLEGVVFTDGTVAVRWMTDLRSMSYWDSFDTFEAVHGHPEYETRIEWLAWSILDRPGRSEDTA